jgi:hypothetical protein
VGDLETIKEVTKKALTTKDTKHTKRGAGVSVGSMRFFRVFRVFRGHQLRAGQFAPAVEAVLIRHDLSVIRELPHGIAGFSVFSFRFSVNRKNSSLNTDD